MAVVARLLFVVGLLVSFITVTMQVAFLAENLLGAANRTFFSRALFSQAPAVVYKQNGAWIEGSRTPSPTMSVMDGLMDPDLAAIIAMNAGTSMQRPDISAMVHGVPESYAEAMAMQPPVDVIITPQGDPNAIFAFVFVASLLSAFMWQIRSYSAALEDRGEAIEALRVRVAQNLTGDLDHSELCDVVLTARECAQAAEDARTIQLAGHQFRMRFHDPHLRRHAQLLASGLQTAGVSDNGVVALMREDQNERVGAEAV
jgi:hypothetical protein